MEEFFSSLFLEYPVWLISNLIQYDSTGAFYLTGTIRNIVLLIGLLSPFCCFYFAFMACKQGEYGYGVAIIASIPLIFLLISLSSILVHVISGIIYVWINFLPATIAFTLLAIILVPKYLFDFLDRDKAIHYLMPENDEPVSEWFPKNDAAEARRREEEYAWMVFNSNRHHWE